MEKIELNFVNAQNIDTFYMTVDGYAILGILIELMNSSIMKVSLELCIPGDTYNK